MNKMNNGSRFQMTFVEMRDRVRGILQYTPFFQRFDSETIELLQVYFLWRHPEKFLFNDEEIFIKEGQIKVHLGRRFFQLKFNNGYIWLHEKTE